MYAPVLKNFLSCLSDIFMAGGVMDVNVTLRGGMIREASPHRAEEVRTATQTLEAALVRAGVNLSG